MNTLNLGSDDEPVVKKKSNTRNLKIALGLAAVILVPTIGSTLAGTISVSSGSVEFGQGSSQASACDPTIVLTPAASFTNTTNSAGTFALGTVTLTGVADLCSTKTFTIKAWGDTGTAIALTNGGVTSTALVFVPTLASPCTVVAQASANGTYACSYTLNDSTITLTLATVTSAPIYKFTVETA
jgi:hypothetical protein